MISMVSLKFPTSTGDDSSSDAEAQAPTTQAAEQKKLGGPKVVIEQKENHQVLICET